MSQDEIELFGKTKTGVAHCPSSNMRLASGIAKVPAMWQAGVPVGSALMALLPTTAAICSRKRGRPCCPRVAPDRYLSETPGGRGGFGGKPNAMTAREALRRYTRRRTEVLEPDDIGYLAPGMSADFIAVNLISGLRGRHS